MEYVYAALLLDAAGKEINEKNIEEVIKAAGMQPDEAQAKAVTASLKGVDIKEVLKNAQSMQVQAAQAQPAAAAPSGEKKEKKEEKADEKKEDEAAGGLASLFGG